LLLSLADELKLLKKQTGFAHPAGKKNVVTKSGTAMYEIWSSSASMHDDHGLHTIAVMKWMMACPST